MPAYRIDLAYDGSGFRGWAKNIGVRTVQGELEHALVTVLQGEVALSVAGRTDAGVHARHQVASFSGATELDESAVVRSLRTMLGPEISIHSLTRAPDDFDARFSAVRRSYRYFIQEGESHDPLQSPWVWHLDERLDLPAMNLAAAAFVGEHDFASLCRAPDVGTTERTVDEAGWEKEGTRLQAPGTSQKPGIRHQAPATSQKTGIRHQASGISQKTGIRHQASGTSQNDSLLVFSVTAKAFCHQMVRSMVALCVDVGRGRVSPDAVPAILEQKDRTAARGVAPPHGLTLWEVEYQ